MNSTDDSSKRRLRAIKDFLHRNRGKFLLAGFFAVILSVLALVHGIGFTATAKVTYTQILVQGHPCGNVVPYCEEAHSSCMCLLGFAHEGYANLTFNPLLYPVNHMFERDVSTKFALQSKMVPDIYLKQAMITSILLCEFPINFPLFYAVGFILATGLEKAIKKHQKNRSVKNLLSEDEKCGFKIEARLKKEDFVNEKYYDG